MRYAMLLSAVLFAAAGPVAASSAVKPTAGRPATGAAEPYVYICGYTAGSAPTCSAYDGKTSKFIAALNIQVPAESWYQVLVTDEAGNLYSTPGTDAIYVYAPLGASLEQTLSNPGQQTAAIATRSGLIVAGNASPIASQTGELSVYVNGATAPSYYLGDGDATHDASGAAIDSKGDCFVSYNSNASGNSGLEEFAGCAKNAKPHKVAVVEENPQAPAIWNPTFDGHDNLLYLSGDNIGEIFECMGLKDCGALQGGGAYADTLEFGDGFKHFTFIESGDTSSQAFRCVTTRPALCKNYSARGRKREDNPWTIAPGRA